MMIRKYYEDDLKSHFLSISSPWDEVEIEPVRLEETKILYSRSFDIEPELIQRILNAPREQLIRDLENILKHAAKNHDSLVEEFENASEDVHTDYVLHALSFLTELKATESLPVVLDILRMDNSWLMFWLGDALTQDVWEVIYILSENNFDQLLDFMYDRKVHSFCRCVISDAMEQLVYHKPEKRVEVLEWFRVVLQNQRDWSSEDDGFNTDVNGLFIDNLVSLKATDLLPDIKVLYEMEYVSPEIVGTYIDVEILINSPNVIDPKRNLNTLEQRYKEFWKVFYGKGSDQEMFDDNDDSDSDLDMQYPLYKPEPQQPVLSEKIGRNEPCPCGSGLKYKKCCLGRGIVK